MHRIPMIRHRDGDPVHPRHRAPLVVGIVIAVSALLGLLAVVGP